MGRIEIKVPDYLKPYVYTAHVLTNEGTVYMRGYRPRPLNRVNCMELFARYIENIDRVVVINEAGADDLGTGDTLIMYILRWAGPTPEGAIWHTERMPHFKYEPEGARERKRWEFKNGPTPGDNVNRPHAVPLLPMPILRRRTDVV